MEDKNLSSMSLKKVIVDKEEFVLLDESSAGLISQNFSMDGYTVAVYKDVLKMWTGIAGYRDELAFGLHLYRPDKWMPMYLLNMSGWLQRVHLEYLSCKACEWAGWSANPLIPELYWNSPIEADAWEQAKSYEKLPCPECGEKLPRPSIWVQQSAESKSHCAN